jgi:hypothetical protein
MGMRVFPYTNAHLFDPQTEDWKPNLAQHAAVKMNRRYKFEDLLDEHPDLLEQAPVLNITEKDFVYDFNTLEPSWHIDPQTSGGGNGTTVSMCPATEYWQEKASDIASTMINEVGFDGVYMDQIGCVPVTPCFDRTHNHTMGGGHHWQNGA